MENHRSTGADLAAVKNVLGSSDMAPFASSKRRHLTIWEERQKRIQDNIAELQRTRKAEQPVSTRRRYR